MSIKAIIFDLYGTLITRQERVFLRELSKYYMQTLGQSKTLSQLGMVGLEIIKTLMVIDLSARPLPPDVLETFAVSTEHAPEDIAQAFRHALIAEVRSTKLLAGVKSILAFFRARGYRLGLVSNASTYHKQPLYDFDLARFFETVVFSCDVGRAKPHPDIYLLACRQLGVSPEEVLFVGDSYNMDVETPLQLGMQALHVSKSGRYTHHIDTVAQMGLLILTDECYDISRRINTAPPLVERQIHLNMFILMTNHHDRQCLTYICSGVQAGTPCDFFLQRFLVSSPLLSVQCEHPHSIPVTAGSETLLLTPCLKARDGLFS